MDEDRREPADPTAGLRMLPVVTVENAALIEVIRAGAQRAGRGPRVIVLIDAERSDLLAACADGAEAVIDEVTTAGHVAALAGIRALGGQGFPVLEVRTKRGAARITPATSILLGDPALRDVNVPVPAIADEWVRQDLWDQLRAASIEERHHLVEVDGVPALEELRVVGLMEPDDAWAALSAGAAGVLAGRLAASNRRWRGQLDD